ncbi:hypothetical protein [Erwinia psidii]|uniref:hypothetical protein n=1 Tax=Erwinia psidii TaxID=69224 RepID=UPI0013152110|nr:hypothetical protein [Erwinia psidii]
MIKSCITRQHQKITTASPGEGLIVLTPFFILLFNNSPNPMSSDMPTACLSLVYHSQRLFQAYKGATKTSKAFT